MLCSIDEQLEHCINSKPTKATTTCAGRMSPLLLPSRCHALPAAIPPLAKEVGELVEVRLLLTEHQVPSRFEAEKSGAGDALCRAVTRLVRCKLVVLGMGDQGGHAD